MLRPIPMPAFGEAQLHFRPYEHEHCKIFNGIAARCIVEGLLNLFLYCGVSTSVETLDLR